MENEGQAEGKRGTKERERNKGITAAGVRDCDTCGPLQAGGRGGRQSERNCGAIRTLTKKWRCALALGPMPECRSLLLESSGHGYAKHAILHRSPNLNSSAGRSLICTSATTTRSPRQTALTRVVSSLIKRTREHWWCALVCM